MYRSKNETTDISQTSAFLFLLDIQPTLVRQSTVIGDSSYNQREKYYTALKRKMIWGYPEMPDEYIFCVGKKLGS